MLRFILYLILFYIVFRLIKSLLKFLSGNSNTDTRVEGGKPKKSDSHKYENIEDAKYTEIKDDKKMNKP